jgi:hypothetical protein
MYDSGRYTMQNFNNALYQKISYCKIYCFGETMQDVQRKMQQLLIISRQWKFKRLLELGQLKVREHQTY